MPAERFGVAISAPPERPAVLIAPAEPAQAGEVRRDRRNGDRAVVLPLLPSAERRVAELREVARRHGRELVHPTPNESGKARAARAPQVSRHLEVDTMGVAHAPDRSRGVELRVRNLVA